MQVFKAYFRVLRHCLPSMLINLFIFLTLSIVFSVATPRQEAKLFTDTQTPIAIINRDADTPLTQGLTGYLAKTYELVAYPDDPEQLQDALFFRLVEYIIIIPPGFSADFWAGENSTIQKVIVPDSMSSHYVDLRVNKYLNTLQLYHQHSPGESPAEMLTAVEADLQQQTPVTMQASQGGNNATQGFAYYYRYLSYVMLALLMLGVSTVMLVFNQPDLHRRNLCAPLSLRSMNLQLVLGNGILALVCWVIIVLLSLALYRNDLLSSGLLGLYSLNALIYTVVCMTIGLLVGLFIKNFNTQAAITNIVTLGMSFICGVFVPQSVMSQSVLAVSKFLPTYWYVKAADAISSLPQPTTANLLPIYAAILIQLGFAVAIFSLTLLLSKERRLHHS